MNPKFAHIAAEIVQFAGYITAAASLPAIAGVAPWIGAVSGIAALIATILKPYASAAIINQQINTAAK